MGSVAKSIKNPYSVISAEDMLAKITRFNSRVSAPGTGSENNIPTDSSYSKADGNNTDIMNIIETSPDMPEYFKLEGEGCPKKQKSQKKLASRAPLTHNPVVQDIELETSAPSTGNTNNQVISPGKIFSSTIIKNRDIHETSTAISPSHMVVEGDPQKQKIQKNWPVGSPGPTNPPL